jgi:peptidoglycan/LPS O-acetylase OafA/YrhL
VRPEVLGVLGNPILLEFVAGMILAAGYRRLAPTLRTDASRAGIRVWSALFLAYFGWGLCSSRIEGNGILAKGGPAAALIAGGILLESSLSRPRAPGSLLRALLWLGAVSYPLYLVQFGFAPRILRFLCSFFLGWRVIGIGGFAGLLALSLAVAALLHRWLELPFIAMGKRLVEWRRGRSARPAPPAAAG